MAYCSNCGYKLNGKEKFCPSCGIKIAKRNGKINDNKEEEKEVEKEEISIAKIIDKTRRIRKWILILFIKQSRRI